MVLARSSISLPKGDESSFMLNNMVNCREIKGTGKGYYLDAIQGGGG